MLGPAAVDLSGEATQKPVTCLLLVATPPRDLWDNQPDASLDLAAALDRAEVPRSPHQIELLERFRAYYAEAGLLPNQTNPSLWRCCSKAEICWAGLPDAWKREDSQGITLPWIGPDYHRERVAVLGCNLRSGGLLTEYQVVKEVREAFMDGDKEVHGSVFAYRSTTAVAALIASAHGETSPHSRPDPRTLVAPLEACARLQTVKCSPADGDRNNPHGAMSRESPALYLAAELRLLAPRRLLALGRVAREALKRLFPGDWHEQGGFAQRTVSLGTDRCEVFCVAHPSSHRHWWRPWWELTQALDSSG